MARPNEFSRLTRELALARQNNRCACCGTHIFGLGASGRAEHEHGEIAHAHHAVRVADQGTASIDNCVILCQSCHYTAHEGGNYRYGSVSFAGSEYPYFRG